jgi:hypothetical protein
MISKIKKSIKLVSITLLLIFIQTLIPYHAFALTSGPVQEEFTSFEPVTTTDMVDLYSGKFNYNIPLLNVPGPNGGYPINLAYHGGVGMDQEASWVGLGWSLNVGAVNRNLRGLPDDFDGDMVKQTMHTRKSWGIGLDFSLFPNPFSGGSELFGRSVGGNGPPATSIQGKVYYNNNKGLGYNVTIMPEKLSKTTGFFQGGLGLSIDSQNGIGVDVNMSINLTHKNYDLKALGLSGEINSRNGLQSFGLSTSITRNGTANVTMSERDEDDKPIIENKKYQSSISSETSYSSTQNVPNVSIPMLNATYPIQVKLGTESGFGLFESQAFGTWNGSYFKSEVANDGIVESKAYGYLNTQNAVKENLTDFNQNPTNYSKHLPFLSPSTVTHDLFSVTGQGTGGTFRAYRSDVRNYSAKKIENESVTRRINAEYGQGAPMFFHGGLGGLPWKAGSGIASSGPCVSS